MPFKYTRCVVEQRVMYIRAATKYFLLAGLQVLFQGW